MKKITLNKTEIPLDLLAIDEDGRQDFQVVPEQDTDGRGLQCVFLVKSVESSFGRRGKDDQSWQNRIKQTKAKKSSDKLWFRSRPKKTFTLNWTTVPHMTLETSSYAS